MDFCCRPQFEDWEEQESNHDGSSYSSSCGTTNSQESKQEKGAASLAWQAAQDQNLVVGGTGPLADMSDQNGLKIIIAALNELSSRTLQLQKEFDDWKNRKNTN